MALYYCEIGGGNCTLRVGRRATSVEKELLREVGTNTGVYLVRKATEEDIANVEAMGGCVPKEGD